MKCHYNVCIKADIHMRETRLMCILPELVESVFIRLKHLPHVQVSSAGFVPLFQFAVVWIACEAHDEKIELFFGPKLLKRITADQQSSSA